MDPFGKKELLSFYDRHLKDFGDSPLSLRWSPGGQIRRYETLLGIAGDVSGKRILDFGCGKGDFYGFLKGKGISVKYCGNDINENLIALAKKKYPEAEFISVDIEESEVGQPFDIIFICGVFNLRIAGIEESMREVLRRLYGLCNESLHANFLTFYVPQRNVELYYVKPEELLGFTITELSRSVTVRNAEEDIFLSVYRDPSSAREAKS